MKISRYFSTYILTEGLSASIAGSIPIYLLPIGVESATLTSASALFFIYTLLKISVAGWFFCGFFIGIFWFWWIGVSFLHYGQPWLLIPAILVVALSYAALFSILAAIASYAARRVAALGGAPLRPGVETLMRGVAIYLFSYIHPFGFDWFRPQILFVHSFFGVSNLHFASIIVALALFRLTGRYGYLLLLTAALSVYGVETSYGADAGDIYLASTNVSVERKWKREELAGQIREVLQAIDTAVRMKKRAVVLPESALPLFLNREKIVLDILRQRSENIDIVVGALYSSGKENRNSAYLFHKGRYVVAHKVVLVPFGESNPLPGWLGGILNDIFFDGAPDYEAATKSTDFRIGSKLYRIAICYEGTSDEIYEDSPERVIVISNNGWFHPSIEPQLQRLLMEYRVLLEGVSIYHSANMSRSFTIKRLRLLPSLKLFKKR